MCDDKVIRRMAGIFVILSVAAGWWVNPWFFAFTAFVGFNLLQSSFTNFCIPEKIFAHFGLFGCKPDKKVPV